MSQMAVLMLTKQELACITKLSSYAITKAKGKYLSSLGNKLNDPQTGAKSYWSILNKFLQKKRFRSFHQFA